MSHRSSQFVIKGLFIRPLRNKFILAPSVQNTSGWHFHELNLHIGSPNRLLAQRNFFEKLKKVYIINEQSCSEHKCAFWIEKTKEISGTSVQNEKNHILIFIIQPNTDVPILTISLTVWVFRANVSSEWISVWLPTGKRHLPIMFVNGKKQNQ